MLSAIYEQRIKMCGLTYAINTQKALVNKSDLGTNGTR